MIDTIGLQYWPLINNFVVWCILIVAFIAYAALFKFSLFPIINTEQYHTAKNWQLTLRYMLSALPLLGLLGTIVGLKDTFFAMASTSLLAQQEYITKGISDALFTTQLGLVLVIPGILLITFLNYRCQQWQLKAQHEIIY